jgi:hypothetical protein
MGIRDHYQSRFLKKITLILSISLVSGCGGDGNQTIYGTVAIGSPLVGVVVSGKCGDSTILSAPTSTMGEYKLSTSTLPCILSARSENGTLLRSMAAESGTANITPVTELISLQASFDFSKLASSSANVKSYLKSIGVDAGDSPIATPFVANGVGHDAQLDKLTKVIASVIPITGSGSTSTTSMQDFLVKANSTISESSNNTDTTLVRLSEYVNTWTSFWRSVGASDQVYGFVEGAQLFVASYSTHLKDKFKKLPKAFDELTNKQVENLESFAQGWKTCGYQENATGAECAMGRLSAVIVDLGYKWIGTAAKTVAVVGSDVAIESLDASFSLYDNITTSMVTQSLRSGTITKEDRQAFLDTNRLVQEYAKSAYIAARLAADAKQGISKVNEGVRTLRYNFRGKNINRLSNMAKVRSPFKKMALGTKESIDSVLGSFENWSDADKALFKSYLSALGDALVNEIYDGDFRLSCPMGTATDDAGLCAISTVNSPDPVITGVSPSSAQLNTRTAFTLLGSNIPANAALAIADAECENTSKPNAITVYCTPRAAGNKTVTVKDQPGGTQLYSTTMTIAGVSLPPDSVVTGVSPSSAQLNTRTAFTLLGSNIPANAALAIADAECENTSKPNATTVYCTPRAAGNKTVTVKDQPGGTQLYSTTMTIAGASLPPDPVVTGVSPSSAQLNTRTAFTLLGSNIPANAALAIADAECENTSKPNATTVYCTPRAAGNKTVIVKDQPGGTQLYTNTLSISR